MAFTFVLGHIPGKANAVADLLSRMYTRPALKLQLRVSEEVPVMTVEVTLEPKLPDKSLFLIQTFDLTNP